MRPRTLLVMALTVALLGGFILFYERNLPSTDERLEQAKKVLRFDAEEVSGLTLEWSGKRVRLERETPVEDEDEELSASPSAPWRLVEPIEGLADGPAVDTLLSSLEGLEHQRVVDDPDREELGLEEPRAKVTVTTAGQDSVLEVGTALPVGNGMVVAVAGAERAYQVDDGLYGDLTKAPGDWRSKEMFTWSRGDVEQLALSGRDGQTLALERRGEAFWLVDPLSDRADEDLLNGLLSDLVGLRAESFVDEPSALTGFEPLWTLGVTLAGRDEPYRLELGAEEDGGRRLARVGPQLFETTSSLARTLTTPAEEWASRQWTPRQSFEIDALTVTSSGDKLELSQEGATWRRGEDEMPYAVVSDLLQAISEAKAESLLPAASLEGREPTANLALSAGEQGTEELALYAPKDSFALATSGDRQAVLALDESVFDDLMAKLDSVRQAEPVADDAEDPEGSEDENA